MARVAARKNVFSFVIFDFNLSLALERRNLGFLTKFRKKFSRIRLRQRFGEQGGGGVSLAARERKRAQRWEETLLKLILFICVLCVPLRPIIFPFLFRGRDFPTCSGIDLTLLKRFPVSFLATRR